MLKIKYSLFILVLFLAGCTQKQESLSDEHKAEIDNYISQYVPYPMYYDASNMKEPDKTILKKLVLAAAYVDSIYWLQSSKYGIHLTR